MEPMTVKDEYISHYFLYKDSSKGLVKLKANQAIARFYVYSL